MEWNKHQTHLFARNAIARAGDGWELLGPYLKEALIAREVIGVLTGQCLDTISTRDVRALWRDTLLAAGLNGEAA